MINLFRNHKRSHYFLVAALVLGTLTSLLPSHALAASTNLYMANSGASSGSDLYVQVRTSTGSQQIDSVEADFTYPTSLLTYVGTDNTGSAFDVNASETGGSGAVSVQVGSTTPQAGDLLVATIHFTVGGPGISNLNFQNTSVVLNGGVNVLSQTNNAKFLGIAGPLVPVYRLYNTGNNDRLLTMDANERAFWDARPSSGWTDEGVAFYASQASAAGLSPVYRFYNGTIHDRLLTMDANEKAYWDARPSSGWSDEGVNFYAATSSMTGLTPVYRLYNTGNHDRLLTMDANERAFWDARPSSGWTDEGVAFYAAQ